MKFNFFLLLAGILFALACNQSPTSQSSKTELTPIYDIFQAYYQEGLVLNPEGATQAGDNRYNDKFAMDITEEHREKKRAYYTKYQNALKQYDRSKLSANDAMSYDILDWECQQNLAGLMFPEHLMPINQFYARTLDFPLWGSGSGMQPFKTEKDYDNWLARAALIPVWCDTAIANMRRGIQTGVVLPKVLAAKVLPQIKGVIVKDPKQSTFYEPVKNFPDSLGAEAKERLTKAYSAAISGQILPAYQRLYDFFEKEYLPACRESHGISAIPTGKEYYAHLVKTWTTTNLTPDEIFDIGQKEVARIRKEMEEVKNQVGFKGDLKSFFAHVTKLPVLCPYTKDEQAIESFRNIHKKMEPYLKQQFDLVPNTKFEVRQTEAFREASASAEYYQGTPDGTRPGIFYCPVLNPKDYNIFQDEALFLHEAIPGHHYQISLQQENTELPDFRRFLWYGAYGEGYAVYTENLGKDLGLYTDPYQYFGKLGMEMHRAIRLVVDVGMHTKGWTREQAIQYSLDNEAETEANTIAEIERYLAIPGQALSYKIGQLKILELKERAKTQLGDKFDVKAFHNQLLRYGCLPLTTLESKINEWVASAK